MAEASESVSLILSGCFFSGQPRSAAISLPRPYFLSLAAFHVTRVELGAQNTVPGNGSRFSAAAPRQATNLKVLGKLTGLQDLNCAELLPGRVLPSQLRESRRGQTK